MVVTPDGLSLGATVLLLLPMMYFLIASLTFFLRGLDDPVVSWMLRGLFNVYFTLVMVGSSVALVAFLAAGRPAVAGALGLVLGCAVAARRWFLRRMDAAIQARDSGDARAVRALRGLHLRGIAYNAVQLAAVVGGVPAVFGTG
jgi:hypothetical protein